MNCCNKEMRIFIETKEFVELKCESCRDTIYIKKNNTESREMLDD